jgi:hypothetical protein
MKLRLLVTLPGQAGRDRLQPLSKVTTNATALMCYVVRLIPLLNSPRSTSLAGAV